MAGESITLIICRSYSGLADWDKQANFLVVVTGQPRPISAKQQQRNRDM